MNPFHFSFKVKDLPSTKMFYGEILGCDMGRATDEWIDFDFFGSQISAHVSDNRPPLDYCGTVDDVSVPIPHFGCILSVEEFSQVEKRLKATKINFVISPRMRYEGMPGEQRTMFVLDFSDNPIEFKCFTRAEEIFSKQ